MEGLAVKVVVGLLALLPDDEAPDLYSIRLKVILVGAVVADEGVGGHHNLPGVGGVGQHLLIAHHAGIEDHLAVGIDFSAK